MAVVTGTSIQQEPPLLRKRLRVFERTSSSDLNPIATSDVKGIPTPDIKMENGRKDNMNPMFTTDYGGDSDSTGDERPSQRERKGERVKPPRPAVETEHLHRHRSHKENSPMSPTTRAWYEFDLAVVVALVSPIGNWLTGGDHVKNLLLIVLLIFYLHQIIEVPWTLYQKSRPHQGAGYPPPSGADADSINMDARYAQLAASELQKFELLFLFLTFLSPLVGAALLRYATAAVLGPDAVSWFSTGLFVLATGMRPWSHLVDRLNSRTEELQDFIHYPSVTRGVNERQHKHLEDRLAHLEKLLNKVEEKVEHAADEVYDYVDDAVDSVEHSIRKQDRKWEKYEDKVKEVEQVVVRLASTSSNQPSRVDAVRAELLYDIGILRTYLGYIVKRIVPPWILAAVGHNFSAPRNKPSSTMLLGGNSKTFRRPLSGSTSPSSSASPLETIPEEEVVDRRQPAAAPLLAQPYSFTSNLIYRAGYVATAPLRAVVRMVLRNY